MDDNAHRFNSRNTPYFIKDNETHLLSTKHGFKGTKLGRQSKKDAILEYAKKENILPLILTAELQQNAKEICDNLGVKHTPMSFLEANEGRANKYHHKGGGYVENCQCCVVVHEARRRGIDVTAKAYSRNTNSMQFMLGEDSALAWRKPNSNKAPQVTMLRGDVNIITSKINNQTKPTGRYHIGFNYGEDIGHIITAERLPSGKIIYYDPQKGTFINIKEALLDIESVEILKVNNLLLNDKILKDIIELVH